MKKSKFTAILILSALILNLFGCAVLDKKSASNKGMLEPQAVMKFNDVPVPAGFKLIPKESYSFESSGLRVGLLKYEGKAEADQVVNFYKDQMAMYNWRLLNTIEYNERLMNFDREQETCIIGLIPKGKDVVVTISLGPKSQYPQRATRPVK